MTRNRDHNDPMAGQTFSGVSGSPMAGMPEQPPQPGRGNNRGQTIALVISLLIFIALVAAIIIF